MEAVKVFYGARVHTMEASAPPAQAVAVQGDRIAFVGEEGEALRRFPGAERINLRGACVLPGFVDSHIHLLMYGERAEMVETTGRTKAQILEGVARAAGQAPAGGWILGAWGWNNEHWTDKALPTRQELDTVSPGHPVCLPKYDGHMIWVNTAALALAAVDRHTPCPVGGEIVRDAHGEPTGCLTGTAKELVARCIPKQDGQAVRRALLAAQRDLFRCGITTVQEAGTEPAVLDALHSLYQSEAYKLRVSAALPLTAQALEDPAWTGHLTENKLLSAYGGRFACRTLKLLVDGSLSSQSAALRADYSDRPGHRGKLSFTHRQLRRCVELAAAHGMQVMAHSIGDAASEQLIRVVEEALPEHGPEDRRFRLEHFHVAPDDLLERVARCGMLLSVQPTHGPMNPLTATKRLGERIPYCYSYRRELARCGRLALGSDAPVSDPSPLYGMYAAAARKDIHRQPENGFVPSEAIPVADALRGYTVWGAHAQFREEQIGTLARGKAADLVVLSGDPLACKLEELPDLRVLMTVAGGELVYRDGAL